MKDKVFIYDTTLRDGSQAEGVAFSKADKVKIVQLLDEFGVSYIEGGWPGSNPRDMEFFEAIKDYEFKNAKLAAFGSTRRAKLKVEDDDNIKKLLESEAPVVTIFGKSWILHCEEVLRITKEQNLEIIADSCAYLKKHGREVIFDAEHYFDGYKDNSEYAIEVAKTAAENGATTIVLCDTNGGSLPSEIAEITKAVVEVMPDGVSVGIHCHNDSELAVANSLSAVQSGAKHIQGTVNGFGERCGNANLSSIIPALELKMGRKAIADGKLSSLKKVSYIVDELANIEHNKRLPFVGDSAFAHKGGMHVNAVGKNPITFEHISPDVVGNKRRILVSDLSGRANIAMKIEELPVKLDVSSDELKSILDALKEKENSGYEYEAADASFSLLVKRVINQHYSFFELDGFRVAVGKRDHNDSPVSEATVKVIVNGEKEITAAEGDGPVNALDLALRKALTRFYPEIANVYLKDFKVRILEGDIGTDSKTRVLIESGTDEETWGTVGVSENIIEASWEALADSVEYFLYKLRS